MRLRPAMVWVMVVALVLGSLGIGWSLLRFQDQGNSAAKSEVLTCDDLREFILSEEDLSFAIWKKYHKQVITYSKGVKKSERPEMVRKIAANVSLVLQSDLRIYRAMKKQPECLTPDFRNEINEWTSTTREMIDYLAGKRAMEGERFDPDKGLWDVTFYDAFYSAAENLSKGLTQI